MTTSVADHHGRRAVADLADPDRAILSSICFIMSTMPFSPKCRRAGRLRVQRDEVVSRRRGEDPLTALAVGPIRDPAVNLARRLIEARALVGTIGPEVSPVAAFAAITFRRGPA
jgi:hypothetical protein